VSFYYVFDATDSRVETIVAEITNTPWKERHAYVLPATDAARRGARAWHFSFEKQFHVSPFLPMGMRYEWTGLTLDEIESSGRALLIFGLGILVVYLTLSAQYESFALPFIILLAVPMAVLGALGLVSLRGLSNDVYCQIGLVMLIGLSAKNSILIVEFAEQLRRKGRSIAEAAIEAAELRLRPILMTSFAFILGVLPLVFATGAGALGRRSVGTTIVGGMLFSTVLNLIFIPVLYVILSRLLRRGDDHAVTHA